MCSLQKRKAIPLAFYKNGFFLFRGPFRPYADPTAQVSFYQTTVKRSVDEHRFKLKKQTMREQGGKLVCGGKTVARIRRIVNRGLGWCSCRIHRCMSTSRRSADTNSSMCTVARIGSSFGQVFFLVLCCGTHAIHLKLCLPYSKACFLGNFHHYPYVLFLAY